MKSLNKIKNSWKIEITHKHEGKIDNNIKIIDEDFVNSVFDYRIIKFTFERMLIEMLTEKELKKHKELDEYISN
jgi:hypothetical protein